MIDLLRRLEALEDSRVEMQAKATNHRDLADRFELECRELENEISDLVREIHEETKPHRIEIDCLSRAERQVFAYLEEGLAHKEIADKLHISERTSKFHASNIYAKLKVPSETRNGSRTAAARLLMFKRMRAAL